MEHFIDKYLPISTQQMIGWSIVSITSHKQLMNYQKYELEKFKSINDDLLSDEDNLDMKQMMQKVGMRLKEELDRMKDFARQQGVKYTLQKTTESSKMGVTVKESSMDTNPNQTFQVAASKNLTMIDTNTVSQNETLT